MSHLRPWFDRLWRSVTEYQTGRHIPHPKDTKISFSRDFWKTQWCVEFEKYMRTRLVMGALRYGAMGSEGKTQWNRIADVIRRAQAYEQTGNDELLVDIANLAMLEYVEGTHPKKHFSSVDDGTHTEPL